MKKYKIIFLGTPGFALPSLQALIKDASFEVGAVITEPDKPAGRNRKLTPPPVKILAEKYYIPVWQPDKIRNLKLKIKNLQPHVAVVVAYGQIIPKEILEIPEHGFINIHPSLLPKYRGPAPIQAAILNNNKQTGVTLMKMDEKMDHGDVVASCKLQGLSCKVNYQNLSEKLARVGADLLIKTLPDYLAGKIKGHPQNHQKATYTKLIKKVDGLINWKEPIKIIERKIRAYNPWPGCFTYLNGKRLKIIKAHLESNKLVFDEVQLEGKKPLNWQEFKLGWKQKLDFSDQVMI